MRKRASPRPVVHAPRQVPGPDPRPAHPPRARRRFQPRAFPVRCGCCWRRRRRRRRRLLHRAVRGGRGQLSRRRDYQRGRRSLVRRAGGPGETGGEGGEGPRGGAGGALGRRRRLIGIGVRLICICPVIRIGVRAHVRRGRRPGALESAVTPLPTRPVQGRRLAGPHTPAPTTRRKPHALMAPRLAPRLALRLAPRLALRLAQGRLWLWRKPRAHTRSLQ